MGASRAASGKSDWVGEANARLKVAKLGVTIQALGKDSGWLYLRAKLPPKPGDFKHSQPFTQRIALGLRASQANIKVAEVRAAELHSQLAWQRFDWNGWGDFDPRQKTAAEWIAEYKVVRMALPQYAKARDPEYKWRNEEWHCGLSGLNPSNPVDRDACLAALEQKQLSSRSRQLTLRKLRQFIEFVGTDFELVDSGRAYNLDRVERYIPEDDEVVACWRSIPERSQGWKNFYALVATYGLRPHEAFLGQVVMVEVGDRQVTAFQVPGVDTKTGARLVAPIPEAWVELFGVRPGMDLPKVLRAHRNRAASQFKRYSIPFPPYALRHRYSIAGNTVEGLGVASISAFMGHDPSVNQRIYQRHLDDKWAWKAYIKRR